MDIDKLYILFLAQGQKITTDTRKIEKGQIFFALKGANFDGNKFAKDALKMGARYAVVDDKNLASEKNVILVDNVLNTLQQLALYHRRKINIPIIAITGSNGKTTSKELIKEVLAKKFKVAYTKGNLNNHIGIPLTLLDIKAYEDISIIEMGANHQGEIASYCTYTEPNFGLITNIGKAHLEGFGGVEGVIKGKSELYNYIRSVKGRIFINIDDPILVRQGQDIQQIQYGTNPSLPIYGEIVESEHELLSVKIVDDDKSCMIRTQLTGDYNLYNVLAAYKIAKYFEVSMDDIKDAIEHYIPSNSRSQLIKKGSLTIILDAYNANPSSMEVALKNLSKQSGRKVAIIGAMKELGESVELEHAKMLQLALDIGINEIVAIGHEYQLTQKMDNIIYLDNTDEAKNWYKKRIWTNETILVKGSRSMALEKLFL